MATTLKKGAQYGQWTILDDNFTRRHGHPSYLCQCACGYEGRVSGRALTHGKSTRCRSCRTSAVNRRLASEGRHSSRKHGHTSRSDTSPTYQTWRGMISRCTRPYTNGFRYYGGRGITVCDRWTTFGNFLEDMGERPEGMTLDRIDVNGRYEPSNCKWSTPKEQAQNKRKAA